MFSTGYTAQGTKGNGHQPSNRTVDQQKCEFWTVNIDTTTHNNRFMALCPGLPGWASTRRNRNTHPPSWSSSNLYQLLPSTTIHSILLVQITCLAIFLHNLFPCPLWCTSWSGLEPSTSYSIHFFTKSCLLFTTHAHTIATCFAVVSILYHLFLVLISTPYLELCHLS